MKLRFLDSIAVEHCGEVLWFHAGTEQELPEKLATKILAGGRAVECAALASPPETAMKRMPQPKGRGRAQECKR